MLESEFTSRRLVLPKAPPLSGDFDIGGPDFGPGAGKFAGEGIALGDGHGTGPVYDFSLAPPATLLLESLASTGTDDWNGPELTRQSLHPTGAVSSQLSTESYMTRLPFLENARQTGEVSAIWPSNMVGLNGGAGEGFGLNAQPEGMRLSTNVVITAGSNPGSALNFDSRMATIRSQALTPFQESRAGSVSKGMGGVASPSVGQVLAGGFDRKGGTGAVERAARAEIEAQEAYERNTEEKRLANNYERSREKYKKARGEATDAEVDLGTALKHGSKAEQEAAKEKVKVAKEKEASARVDYETARDGLGLEGDIPTGDADKEERRDVAKRIADDDAAVDAAQAEANDAREAVAGTSSASPEDVESLISEAKHRLRAQRANAEEKAKRKYSNPSSVLSARAGTERAREIREASHRRESRLSQIRGKGDDRATAEAKAASEAAVDAARDAARAEREREKAGKTGTREQAQAADQRAIDAQEKARQKDREAREKFAKAEEGVREKKRVQALRKQEESRARRDPTFAKAKSHERRAAEHDKRRARHEKRADVLKEKADDAKETREGKDGKPIPATPAARRRAEVYEKAEQKERERAKAAEGRRDAEKEKAQRRREQADRRDAASKRRQEEKEKEKKNSKYRDVHKLDQRSEANKNKAADYREKEKDYRKKAEAAEKAGWKHAAAYFNDLADEADKKADPLEESAKKDEEERKKKQDEIDKEEREKAAKEEEKKKTKKNKDDKKQDDTVVPLGTWPNCGPPPSCTDPGCGCPPWTICLNPCSWVAGDPAQKGKGASTASPPDTGPTSPFSKGGPAAEPPPANAEEASKLHDAKIARDGGGTATRETKDWAKERAWHQHQEKMKEPGRLGTAARDRFTREEAEALVKEWYFEVAWQRHLSTIEEKEWEGEGGYGTAPRDEEVAQPPESLNSGDGKRPSSSVATWPPHPPDELSFVEEFKNFLDDLRRQGLLWAFWRDLFGFFWDNPDALLTLIGLIPGIGEVADFLVLVYDLLNALTDKITYSDNQTESLTNASLSAAALLPIGGQIAGVTRILNRLRKWLSKADSKFGKLLEKFLVKFADDANDAKRAAEGRPPTHGDGPSSTSRPNDGGGGSSRGGEDAVGEGATAGSSGSGRTTGSQSPGGSRGDSSAMGPGDSSSGGGGSRPPDKTGTGGDDFPEGEGPGTSTGERSPYDEGDRAGGPYSSLEDHPSVGPGKRTTATQRRNVLAENRARNGGKLRSDLSGRELEQPQQHTKGVRPPDNEAQVDHIDPRSKGGSNRSSNLQVLARDENIAKGASSPGDRP